MEILEIIGVPYFKKGKGIHIKKKNRGKFTLYCNGKVTQECIDKAKKSNNPTLRKRAVFAENARKWKHQEGGVIKAQEGTSIPFLQKLGKIIQESGTAARDARVGAIGAQQVRDLYTEGKNQEALDLAKQYAKANTTGIAMAGGAASTSLLGDSFVTGATTTADTIIDGDVNNLSKNILKNITGDLLGHGTAKTLKYLRTKYLDKYIDYINETRRKELFPRSEDVYYHLDDARRSRFNTYKKMHPSEDASYILPGEARDEGSVPYIWFSKGLTYGSPKNDRIVLGSKKDLNLKPIRETDLPHNDVDDFYVTEGYPNTNKVQMFRGYPISIGGSKPVYVFGKEIFYKP